MELISFIRQHVQLPAEMEAALDHAFKREEHPKHYKLLQPDNWSKKVCFVEQGLIRTYYLKDGKDITHHFFPENSFNMPIESIFYGHTSPYGVELLENSVVRTISYPDVEKYFGQSSELEKFIRFLLIDVLKSFSDRLYALQFQSAQERYKTMIDNYPNILLRAPLGNVASYLGITQETLSRIRAVR